MLERQLNNLVLVDELDRVQRDEQMRGARQTRRLLETRALRLTLMDRFIVRLGGFLISTGKKLQARNVLMMPPGTNTHASKC
jgi:hypothetical protein